MSAPTSRTPYPFCVLGSQAAGKSCFLAGLALMGDASTDSGVQVLGAAGTDTQRWLNELKTALRGGRWPPPTSDTRLFIFDLKVENTVFDAAMVDYPGESFLEAMNTLAPDQFELAREHNDALAALDIFMSATHEAD